jgi:hypothetical protein
MTFKDFLLRNMSHEDMAEELSLAYVHRNWEGMTHAIRDVIARYEGDCLENENSLIYAWTNAATNIQDVFDICDDPVIGYIIGWKDGVPFIDVEVVQDCMQGIVTDTETRQCVATAIKQLEKVHPSSTVFADSDVTWNDIADYIF